MDEERHTREDELPRHMTHEQALLAHLDSEVESAGYCCDFDELRHTVRLGFLLALLRNANKRR